MYILIAKLHVCLYDIMQFVCGGRVLRMDEVLLILLENALAVQWLQLNLNLCSCEFTSLHIAIFSAWNCSWQSVREIKFCGWLTIFSMVRLILLQ